MNATIRRPKDFLTGILFVVIGAGVVVIAQDYKFGSARQMGTGFFPIVLGTILIGFAAILLVRSFVGEAEPIGDFAVRPAFYVLGSSLLFSLLLRPAGMFVAIVVMVTLVSRAQRTMSLTRSFLVGVALAAGSAFLFVYLLGQNLPLVGSVFGG